MTKIPEPEPEPELPLKLAEAMDNLRAVGDYPVALALLATQDGAFMLTVRGNGVVTDRQFAILTMLTKSLDELLVKEFGTPSRQEHSGKDHGVEVTFQ